MRLIILVILMALGLPVFGQTVRKVKITEIESLVRESRHPLIINFWATFCKPCIEELPHFEAAQKAYKADSLTILLVSLDMEESYPTQITAFLQKRKVGLQTVWLDEFDADYFCPKVDPKWSGAIPATLFVNNGRAYRVFHEEQLSAARLAAEIKAMLGK